MTASSVVRTGQLRSAIPLLASAAESCRPACSFYLLITTGADVVLFPEVSVATTVIVCCPLASDPVSHHCVDWQVAAPPQDTWANWLPSPKYVSVARATLSPPLAVTSMLLPVHAPFEGLVIVTVGGVVSPVPVLFDTVMLTDAVAVRPAPSVAAKLSVWAPLATAFVVHAEVAVDPLLLLWLD